MAQLDSGLINFDSSTNLNKIYINGSQDVSVADPEFETNVTVQHDLGYFPLVRVWFEDDSGAIAEAAGEVVTFIGMSDAWCYFDVYTDRVEIYYDRGATSGPTESTTIYWRIYLDAA